MGLFGNQLANVVEWEEYRDDVIFWKWTNREIKKGSKLVIRPGQDAIFMYNGKVEGIFTDEGSFDIESDIIPFLSTLKGFKFGFNSGMRAEVLFVNTKEFTVKWGTKNPVMLASPTLPGGLPVRAHGTFSFKVSDYMCLIDTIAGVKKQFTVEDVRERVSSSLDTLLMTWLSKAGSSVIELQQKSVEICNGIKGDLDMELFKIGISITNFTMAPLSYTEEVARMTDKAAAQSMVGDMNKYSQMAVADSLGNARGSNAGIDMASMQMGMMMGQQMANSMAAGMNMQNQSMPNQGASNMQYNPGANGQMGTPSAGPKFCPQCGAPVSGAKFCPECGTKLQ
ncbi:MAG: SPFH domain-containing protein [Clostridia bacterium]|nr:SPFH domain-containing protein [[Bacteroides] pectinophilus]MDD5873448.1 SPFH domain-containing protein [Clostridia bacterium]